jgi:rod shape-determining protein MreC
MFKYLREYRFYITLFIFVLIPVIAIDTSTRAPRDYRFYDRVIVAVTSPIQAVITWSLEQVALSFQNYILLLHTRRDNVDLLEENRKLLNQIAGLKETEQENIRLKKALGFQEKYKFQSVVARVISKDVSTEFRAVRINRGERAGIRKNMAVVTDEGVVGRVLRTTADTSDIVTLLDLLSAVDSIVERSRVRGIVEGQTDEACQLRYALRTDDIQPGDVLISSGLGGVFPKGITVGTVSKVNRRPFGITQEVEVRPSVDFSKLEEVMVITHIENEGFNPDKAVSEKAATAPILVLLITLGIALQTSLFSSWPLQYFQPSVVLLATVWLALRRNFTEGGILVLIISDIAEIHSAAPQGLFLISFMAIYFLVRAAARMMVISDLANYIMVTLFGSVAWKLISLFILHLLGASSNQWRHTLLFLFPSAVIEASFGIWVYRWLEKFDRLTFKNQRASENNHESEFLLEGIE